MMPLNDVLPALYPGEALLQVLNATYHAVHVRDMKPEPKPCRENQAGVLAQRVDEQERHIFLVG